MKKGRPKPPSNVDECSSNFFGRLERLGVLQLRYKG
jgi:hypothetical protein